jgi:hypothetical protein
VLGLNGVFDVHCSVVLQCDLQIGPRGFLYPAFLYRELSVLVCVGRSCRRPVDTKNGLVGAVNSTLRFQLLLGVPVDSSFYSSGFRISDQKQKFRSPGGTRPNFELAR